MKLSLTCSLVLTFISLSSATFTKKKIGGWGNRFDTFKKWGGYVPPVSPPGVDAPASTCTSCTDDCDCSDSIDVLFLVDTTGSIAQGDYAKYKQYIKDITGRLNLGNDVKTAMVRFATTYKELYSFGDAESTDHNGICAEVDNFPDASGQTYTHRVIPEAQRILEEETRGGQVCRAMVIMTDGASKQCGDKGALREAMDDFYSAVPDTRVCLVSVGDRTLRGRDSDINFIMGRNITDGSIEPNSEEIIAGTFDDLAGVVSDTLDCLCKCKDDCHCQILADPVGKTCSGATLFMEATGSSYRAAASTDPMCIFTLDAMPEGNSLKLILAMGANMWTISPDGTIVPALPAIPGATVSPFVDGSYAGTKIAFDCGIEIRFGHEGENFVKADIKLPGGKLNNIVDGFCINDTLVPIGAP
jgi:hypothetical protein